MTGRFLFVLRGRPGLGHVIPGLALAHELERRGHATYLVTYGNGAGFLKASGVSNWIDVPLREHYQDWPGYELYDDGVRRIAPVASSFRPQLVFLGGEYLLAPLPRALGVGGAMLFNPEIMEDTERNRLPSRLFCDLFALCDLLIPLRPFARVRYLAEFGALRERVTPPGPFGLVQEIPTQKEGEHPRGLVILIANGGGVSFPTSTSSYSSTGVTPADWLHQTMALTLAAVEAAVAAAAGSQPLRGAPAGIPLHL